MALKTFLLAPDLTLEPDGPIRIGTIIADPFRPTKPIFKPKNNPTTTTHVDFDNSYTRGKNLSLHGSIRAQFLQFAGTNSSGGADIEVATQYTMDSLETIRLRDDPTDAEAEDLVKLPEIRAVIKGGIYRNAPVYMITAVKIAKGFRFSSRTAASVNASAGSIVPVAHDIIAGGEGSFAGGSDTENAWTAGSDIVFAYQLHVIERSFYSRRASVNLHAPSAAFLHQNEHQEVEAEETTVKLVLEEDLVKMAKENEYYSVEVMHCTGEPGSYFEMKK